MDWGLSLYEELFPCVPGYADIESRRAAIMALLQVNDMTFTPKGINITLDGCGINADAAEGPEAQTVTVTFPGTKGTPTNFKSVLKGIIESIIPCHLNIIYVFDYLSWYELEATRITWGVISEMTWLDVERI